MQARASTRNWNPRWIERRVPLQASMRSFKILEQPRKARQKKQSMHGCGEYELSENLKHLQVEPNKWKQMSLPSRQKHIDKFWSAEIDAENFEVLVDKILREMPPETTCHEMAVFECSSPPPSLAGGKVHLRLLQLLFDANLCPLCSGCRELRLPWNVSSLEGKMQHKDPKMVLSDAPNRAGEKNGRSNAKRRGGAAENSCLWPQGRKVCRSFYSHRLWLGTSCAKQTVHRNSPVRKPICPNIRSRRQGVQEEKKVAGEKGRRMQCETCHNEFPSSCIPPYDLALRHYKRWRYPDPTTTMGHGKCPIKRQQSSTTSIRKIALNHDIHISLVM